MSIEISPAASAAGNFVGKVAMASCSCPSICRCQQRDSSSVSFSLASAAAGAAGSAAAATAAAAFAAAAAAAVWPLTMILEDHADSLPAKCVDGEFFHLKPHRPGELVH